MKNKSLFTLMGIWGLIIICPAFGKSQNTYALVIGVSKYKEVSPLLYADFDAQAFVKYLLLDAQVPENNIKTFINEQATRFNIVDEIYHLGKVLQPKDRLYFYFTGHGDLEADLGQENALLLLYNSFKSSYLKGTDYLQLYEIRDWLQNFASKGVQVVFIADACHAGALVGGDIGKSKTNAELSTSWAGVTKLLSCQPKESSLEGRQWGTHGRGLFSNYLLLGLQGFADRNKDKKVSLSELRTYLSSTVPAEAKPHAQHPLILGNDIFILSKVISERDRKMLSAKKTLSSAPVNSRSTQNSPTGELDGSLVDNYQNFLLALKERRLIQPPENCAEYYFNKLITASLPPQVQQLLVAKFAPALEESSTIIMRPITENGRTAFPGNWADNLLAADELKLCLRLIGSEHPHHPVLTLKHRLIELIHERNTPISTGRAKQIKYELLQLYQQYPNLPYLNNLLSIYYLDPAKVDSAELFTRQAIKLLPNASFNYARLGNIYLLKKDTAQATAHYYKALELDSTEANHYMFFFNFYMRKRNYETAFQWGEKALELASGDTTKLAEIQESERIFNIYGLMGRLLSAYHITRNNAKFEHLLQRFEQYAWGDTSHIAAAHFLVSHLRFDTTTSMRNRVYQIASKLMDDFKEAVTQNGELNLSGWSATYGAIARYYKRYDVAEEMYLNEIRYEDNHTKVKPVYRPRSNDLGGYFNGWVDPYLELCILKIETQKHQEALNWLEKSILLGCKRKDLYLNPNLTGPIQQLPEFKKLMDTHFPPGK